MIAYLDSSVVLRKLFNEPNPFIGLSQFKTLVSSALLKTECMRVFSRLRISETLPQDELLILQGNLHTLIESLDLISVSQEILDRAGEDFPTPLKTLDALHFATFSIYQKSVQDPVTLITHDIALARTAKAMGMAFAGVESV